jgi:hypothetical protein
MSQIFKEFQEWLKDFEDKTNFINDTLEHHDIYDTNPSKMKIPRDHYIAGLVSQEVYKDPENRQLFLSSYEIDIKYNTTRTTVYKSFFDNNYIIGIRGTADSFIDILSDTLIFIGRDDLSIRKNRQVKYILEIVESLEKEGYTKKDSFITGHSLGGLLTAYCIEAVDDIKGIGFNTGSSPTQTKLGAKLISRLKPLLNDKSDNLRFINYHVNGDLLSASSIDIFIDTVIIKPKPKPTSVIEAHKISFLLKSTSPSPNLENLF